MSLRGSAQFAKKLAAYKAKFTNKQIQRRAEEKHWKFVEVQARRGSKVAKKRLKVRAAVKQHHAKFGPTGFSCICGNCRVCKTRERQANGRAQRKEPFYWDLPQETKSVFEEELVSKLQVVKTRNCN